MEGQAPLRSHLSASQRPRSRGLLPVVLVASTLALAASYWFAVRPAQIRATCQREAEAGLFVAGRDVNSGERQRLRQENIEDKFANCLRRSGLKP